VEQTMEMLTLNLQGETFAIEAARIQEILDLVPMTHVPNGRPFIDALINVRGKVVPLADLRLKFGLPRTESTIDTRIVVIEINLDGEPTTVGILADKVYEVTELARASMEETPRIGMRWRAEFIRGIAKHGDDFIIIPDIDRIFNAPEPASGPHVVD